jgi:dienelactone hydrolase
MPTRRHVLQAGIASVAALAAPVQTEAANALMFDAKDFTLLEKDIETPSGTRKVKYRFYAARPYVAKPSDAAYQSIVLSVPVEIDGSPVNAASAPVIFRNSVGGYMPSSVAEAKGIGEGGTAGGRPMGNAAPPAEGAAEGTVSGSNAMQARGKMVDIAGLALAAGLTVAEPGARGRTLTDAEGNYYGVAPAAIVDLKAAVRYLRYNAGRIPGNVERIVSTGVSAGGALSALLGATADHPDYAALLADIGAAEASDALHACACWCPITDLENADLAYEWNWGKNPVGDGRADAALSGELAEAFAGYQDALKLTVRESPLGAANLAEHIRTAYLEPAATAFLAARSDADRQAYLSENRNIAWKDGKAVFTWDQFLAHVGPRKKNLPAFDAFDLSSGENNLFGIGKEKARHFTLYSLRKAAGDANATLDSDLPYTIRLMNPMPYIADGNPAMTKNWWLRTGAKDTDTSLTILINLSAALDNKVANVNTALYWDGGHGANDDPEAFLDWVKGLG